MGINNSSPMISRVKLLLRIASYSFLVVGVVLASFSITIVIVLTSISNIMNLLNLELVDLPRITYLTVSSIVSVCGYVKVGDMVGAVDSGRVEGLRKSLLIWSFLGFAFSFIIPGAITLTVLLKYYSTLIKVTTIMYS